MTYVGRFAPSPTGPLHFGSLLAALASYLDAKHQQGLWYLRIENLDRPREMPGAADVILRTLERFGLLWDGSVLYQSERETHYRDLLQQLLESDLAYRCNCSRTALKQRNALHPYDRYCLVNPPKDALPFAIRAKFSAPRSTFMDRIQGPQTATSAELGDFVIFRKDQLFAYQLAVVVDDAAQGINHVVRGADLLSETFAQIQLHHYCNLPLPRYAHIPLAMGTDGQKLSKQNLAPSIEQAPVVETLIHALRFLGQALPENIAEHDLNSLLNWAIQHWSLAAIPKTATSTARL